MLRSTISCRVSDTKAYMTEDAQTEGQRKAHVKAVRGLMGHASITCEVERVLFQCHFGYSTEDDEHENQGLEESSEIHFQGKVAWSSHKGQLSGKAFDITVRSDEKTVTLFSPDHEHKIMGVLTCNSAKTDIVPECVGVNIVVVPEYYRSIAAAAERMIANPNHLARITIGVEDMRDDWKPEDGARLWVTSLNFDNVFPIIAAIETREDQ
jgi:hypothetical protein